MVNHLAFYLKFSFVCREGKFVGDVTTFFIGQDPVIGIRKVILVGMVLVVVVVVMVVVMMVVDVLVWC